MEAILKTIADTQTKRAQQYNALLAQLTNTIQTKNVDDLHALCVESIKLFNSYSITLRTFQKSELFPHKDIGDNQSTLQNKYYYIIDELQHNEQQRLKTVVTYIQQQLSTLHPPECDHDHESHPHTTSCDHHDHTQDHTYKDPTVTPFPQSISPYDRDAWKNALYEQYLSEEFSIENDAIDTLLAQLSAPQKPPIPRSTSTKTEIMKYLEDDTNTDFKAKDRLLNAISAEIQQNVTHWEEDMEEKRKVNKKAFLAELKEIDENIQDIIEDIYSDLTDLLC